MLFLSVVVTFEQEVVYCFDGVIVTTWAEWCISSLDSVQEFVKAYMASMKLEYYGSL